MRASSKRVYSLLLSLAIFAGALLTYIFLITPAYDNIKSLRSDVAGKSQALNEHKDIVQKTQELISQYKGSQSLQSTLSLALPNEPYISQIVADINGLASLNNLKIAGISSDIQPFLTSAGAPQYVKNVGVVKTTVQVVGRYEDLRSLLTQLQTTVRITDVKSITINTNIDTNADAKTKGIVSAGQPYYAFAVSSYYQDQTPRPVQTAQNK